MQNAGKCFMAAAVALLFLNGCGSSDAKSSTPTTAARPKLTKAQEQKLVNGAVLTASDAPEGFTAKAHKKSDSEIPDAAKNDFAKCAGVKSTLFDSSKGRTKADGVDFANSAGEEIANSIEL